MNRILFFFTIYSSLFIYPYFAHAPIYVRVKFVGLTIFSVLLWVGLFIYYIKNREQIRERQYSIKAIYIVTSLFFIFILISTFLSIDMRLSMYGEPWRLEGMSAWLSYLTLFLFASFYPSQEINRLLKYTSIMACITAFYAILQHFKLDFLPRDISRINQTRSYGFFDNPNFFGTYCVLMLFISIALYLSSKNKKTEIIYYLISSIIYVSMIYSLTRSAWLGSAFATIIIIGFCIKVRKDLFKKIGLLLGTFILLFMFINLTEDHSVFTRVSTIVEDGSKMIEGEETDNLGSGRMYIWKNSLHLITDYFWHGSGPDTFGSVFPQNNTDTGMFTHKYVDKAHNEYLQIAITLGVPALLTYLAIVAIVVTKSIKAVRRFTGEKQLLMLGLLTAIIGYLVQAFFNISVVTVAPFYWIFLGLAYRLASSEDEPKTQ